MDISLPTLNKGLKTSLKSGMPTEQKNERWRGVVTWEVRDMLMVQPVSLDMDSLDEVKPWMDKELPALDTQHLHMDGCTLKYDYSEAGTGIIRLNVYANYTPDCNEGDWVRIQEVGTLYCID